MSDDAKRFTLASLPAITAAEEQGTELHLRGPDGIPLYDGDAPVTLRVAGKYSPRVRRVLNRQRDYWLRQKKIKPTREELDRQKIDVCAAALLGWSLTDEFTPENVRVLLSEDWTRDQVEEAMEEHADFSAPPSKN